MKFSEMTDEELKKGLKEATDQAIKEIVAGITHKDFHKSFDVGGTTFDSFWYSYPPVVRALVALRELPDGKIEVAAFAKNEDELIKKLQSERQ